MRDCILIDFDGTITRRDTTRFLILALLHQRPWLLFSIIPDLFLVAFPRLAQSIQSSKDRCIGKLLKGLDQHHIDIALSRYRGSVRPLFRPALMDLIAEKHGDGWLVFVVSASADFAVRFAMCGLPVTVIGTRFQQDAGVFNGQVDKPSCYGENKRACIAQALGPILDDCRFVEGWSDSIADLPMMSLAERHVWVCRRDYFDVIRELDAGGILFESH